MTVKFFAVLYTRKKKTTTHDEMYANSKLLTIYARLYLKEVQMAVTPTLAFATSTKYKHTHTPTHVCQEFIYKISPLLIAGHADAKAMECRIQNFHSILALAPNLNRVHDKH